MTTYHAHLDEFSLKLVPFDTSTEAPNPQGTRWQAVDKTELDNPLCLFIFTSIKE